MMIGSNCGRNDNRGPKCPSFAATFYVLVSTRFAFCFSPAETELDIQLLGAFCWPPLTLDHESEFAARAD